MSEENEIELLFNAGRYNDKLDDAVFELILNIGQINESRITIHANGRTEGFGGVVINRLPAFILSVLDLGRPSSPPRTDGRSAKLDAPVSSEITDWLLAGYPAGTATR